MTTTPNKETAAKAALAAKRAAAEQAKLDEYRRDVPPGIEVTESLLGIRKKISTVQQNVGTIAKNGENPHFKNKYATLDEIWNRVKVELKAVGLVSYCTTEVRDGVWTLTTHIADLDSAEEVCGSFPLPLGSGPQQVGSAMTYARRYTLCALLQIVTADEDDDGNAAQGKPTTPAPNF